MWENDLLAEAGRVWLQGPKQTFPFEKEITLFLLRSWALWPGHSINRANIERLLALIITVHKNDGKNKILSGGLQSLDELRSRANEPWFEQFYESYYSKIDGIGSLLSIGASRFKQDANIIEVKNRRAIAQDMLRYLIRASRFCPDLAQVNIAEHFITQNGFNRSHRYDLRRGERIKPKTTGYEKAHVNWKYCKPTLGLDFVITEMMPELNALKLGNPQFLSILSKLANDDNKIKTVLAQYHWLLDYLAKNLPSLRKTRHWPRINWFHYREEIEIKPLSERQLIIARAAEKETQ